VNAWDVKSGVYHALRRLPIVRRFLDAEATNLVSLLAQADVRPGRVLDLGSGAGSTLGILPKAILRVCSDKSKGMVKHLKAADPEAIVVRTDASSLPFCGLSFDFISAVGLTEYLKDKTVFLAEVRRVLERGGIFIVTVSPPGLASFLRQAHGLRIFPVDQDEWEKLVMSAGFSIIAKKKSLIQHQYILGINKD
jgi:SAM-dependent methyltransferase